MAVLFGAAHGQAGSQPGPMQSGRHVGGDATPAAAPAAPDQPTAAAGQSFDVNKLFAGSCGWCHSKGGREAGKGPMLMGSALTDAEIISRIRNGKTGQMPTFAFSDEQLRAIVAYIRALKPQ
jgi:mono/diheme cytochrome c family protein